MQVEDVEFSSHGVTLAGSIVLPNDTSPIAAVVLVHGSGRVERMMYIARADSQFAGKRKLMPLEKALQAPLILPGLQHGVRPRIENIVRQAGLSIDNVIDINSIAILKSALMVLITWVFGTQLRPCSYITAYSPGLTT